MMPKYISCIFPLRNFQWKNLSRNSDFECIGSKTSRTSPFITVSQPMFIKVMTLHFKIYLLSKTLFFKFEIFRNKFLVNWILPKRKDSKVALWAVLNKVGFGDWLLLYMIARNIDRALFTSLADNIYPPGAGYYPQEDEEDPPRTAFSLDSSHKIMTDS